MFSGYQSKRASLLTQHGKEKVISKEMLENLGLEILHVDSFDTDLFGTFTRDIPRTGNQYEAAYAKTMKGMELADTRIGLASEGLFTGDPYAALLPWNNEIVLLIDEENEIEISGFSSNYAQSYSALISRDVDIDEHLRKAFFPSHQLVMRSDHPDSNEFKKGIRTREEFDDLFRYFFAKSETGKVFIENDLRAFANPTRMENIRTATLNLIEKISSQCPVCESPGFWVTKLIPGLICDGCGNQTKEIKARVYACQKCSYSKEIDSKKEFAEPYKCDVCNP